jgi:hypothetical protein
LEDSARLALTGSPGSSGSSETARLSAKTARLSEGAGLPVGLSIRLTVRKAVGLSIGPAASGSIGSALSAYAAARHVAGCGREDELP